MPHHPTWDYQETKKIIQNIRDPRLQTFARITYLLGTRIMETLPLSNEQVYKKDDLIGASVNSLKTRKGKYIYRELYNSQEEEPYYTQALIDFKEQTKPKTTIQEYLRLGARRNVELHTKTTLGIVPHSFRHLRATHMGHNLIPTKLHQSTAPYLKYYFGWADITTANEYIDSLTPTMIIKQYHEKKKNQQSDI